MKVIINQSSNFAELQNQFSHPNCVYIIEVVQRTFGTVTSPLVIPENSTLIFNGGRFIGGYVRLNHTEQNDIFSTVWESVEISGTLNNNIWRVFKNDVLRPEWFGAVGDGNTDDSNPLQQCIKLASTCGAIVKLSPTRYLINKTINVFSGTHIEGTLPGDWHYYKGTEIIASFNAYGVAIDVNSIADRNFDPSGCHKFILKNFGVINQNSNAQVSAIRLYSDAVPCPREGLIDGISIFGFTVGLDLETFSYVKIQRINITSCKTGIQIVKGGDYIELGWFSNIYINTDVADSVGIKMETGNNIYFNEIDINDCKYGFWVNALTPIYIVSLNRFNIIRCTNAIWLHLENQYITRLKISEVSVYGTPENGTGILLTRKLPFCLDECVFTDLFDGNSEIPNIDFIKNIDMDINSSIFDRIRTCNKISGLSQVKKVGVLTISNYGEFVVKKDTVGFYSHEITSSSPFDYNPIVIVSPQRSIALSSYCSNIQKGSLSVNISFTEDLEEDLLVRYYFPQL